MTLPIENKFPVILTKDQKFIEKMSKQKIDEGSIVLLPKDAVLVRPSTPPNNLISQEIV